jgi:hypothetical protein
MRYLEHEETREENLMKHRVNEANVKSVSTMWNMLLKDMILDIQGFNKIMIKTRNRWHSFHSALTHNPNTIARDHWEASILFYPFDDLVKRIHLFREKRRSLPEGTILSRRLETITDKARACARNWRKKSTFNVVVGKECAAYFSENERRIEVAIPVGWQKRVEEPNLSVVSDLFVLDIKNIEPLEGYGAEARCFTSMATVLELQHHHSWHDATKCIVEDRHLSWLEVDDQSNNRMNRPYTGIGKTRSSSTSALKRSVLREVRKNMSI